MLTDKYLDGIPAGSRAAANTSLSPDLLTDQALGEDPRAERDRGRRGQSLAQMALAWTLRDPRMTSTLIGASSVAQLEDSLGALAKLDFSRRGARRDRPLRDRQRHQPLGALVADAEQGWSGHVWCQAPSAFT